VPQLKGLIFDLDGTLVNSAPDLRHAVNAMLADYGRPPVGLEEVTRMVGDGMMPLIDRAFIATGGMPKDAEPYKCFQNFIGHYRKLQADPEQLYPGAREILEFYFNKGVKLGLCTNKQEASTLKLIEELGLTQYFTFIAGGDTFQYHKPHPDHVKGIIDKFPGVSAENCVMVGDGPNDVRAAHGAGLSCIVVTHGYGGDFEQLGADKLISGFRELAGALRELGYAE
jgi:phosphoglycolate phosphatase